MSDIVVGQILEAAALALVGGAAGILIGGAAAMLLLRDGIPMPPAPGMTRSFRIVVELQGRHALEILALCVSTAVAGCLIPLWRVIRMPIARALRHA